MGKLTIELKYRTKKFEGVVKDEMFKLKHHNARDVGRYHFRQDIYRVEHLVKSKQATGGIALLLTNDNRFWEDDVDTITMDGKFRIGSGLIPKTAEWQWGNVYLSNNHKLVDGIWVSKTTNEPNWTYGKEYTKILTLERDYKAEWKLYSLVENKEFKHLMVVV